LVASAPADQAQLALAELGSLLAATRRMAGLLEAAWDPPPGLRRRYSSGHSEASSDDGARAPRADDSREPPQPASRPAGHDADDNANASAGADDSGKATRVADDGSQASGGADDTGKASGGADVDAGRDHASSNADQQRSKRPNPAAGGDSAGAAPSPSTSSSATTAATSSPVSSPAPNSGATTPGIPPPTSNATTPASSTANGSGKAKDDKKP